MVNSVNTTSFSQVTTVANGSGVSDTDRKVSDVKARIFELTASVENLETTCDALRGKLSEFGVRPNCSIPSRFGITVSHEAGELGELETEMFALQKKQCHLSSVAKNLQNQLAVAEFDKKVTDTTVKVAELEALDKELATKIDGLKAALAAKGESSSVAVPGRMGVIVSNEQAPLGPLQTKQLALQKEVCYKRTVIDALKKKLG